MIATLFIGFMFSAFMGIMVSEGCRMWNEIDAEN